MSFDRAELTATLAQHRRVARVLVIESAGSVPRGPGTSMLVWGTQDRPGQSGTIGGGALEFQALAAARRALVTDKDELQRHALGPNLAQCCGGAVRLLTEIWDTRRLGNIGDVAARALPTGPKDQPLSVTRALAHSRNGLQPAAPLILDGWVIEHMTQPTRPLWVFGAGHVGRAVVNVIHPLPAFQITWVDTDLNRFPEDVPPRIQLRPTPDPARAVPLAPPQAEHLILTYSHHFDLQLCHALLRHGFGSVGLIGSATKWARFRKRLQNLGHSLDEIDKITCPIGDPTLGKHPQAIAVGVVSRLLSARMPQSQASPMIDTTGQTERAAQQ